MIKFDKIIENGEYRERVIKHFRLPIRLTVSKEKFESDLEFIKVTDPVKFENIIKLTEHDFNKEAKEQGTETPDFTLEHILEPIVAKFEANPRWQDFIKQDYSGILDGYEGVTSIHGFYKRENNGKHFISVDLQAANWQSLQDILGFQEDYADFVVKHTENLIPPVSKTFRTKITGVLGAKNIMLYNKKLLKDNKDEILEALFNFTGVDLRDKEAFAFYADEFLIEVDKDTKDLFNSLNLADLEAFVFDETAVRTHLTPFTLEWLNIDKACVKVYKDGNYEILNISKDTLLIVNKILLGVEVKEIDFEGIKLRGKTQEEFIDSLECGLKLIKEIK